MLRKTSLLILALLIQQLAVAQDTLLYENFNGITNAFTLNTSDVGSTGSGYNSWIVNNAYSGGSGSIICLGFPFTFTIPNTPKELRVN